MSARGEGKLVDGAFADCPFVDGITSGFGLARVNGEALPLLEQLIDWRGVGANYIVVVNIHAATSMSC